MGLFTIEFELGRETRRMIERAVAEVCAAGERVATNALVQVELGERTRDTLERLNSPSDEARKTAEGLGGVVAKARDEAKRVTGS
jgi:hypothetical protein